MEDPFDIWSKGIAKFPTYQDDFDKAMSFTVERGFNNEDNDTDDERFSEQFKRLEQESRARSMTGGQDFEEDDMFTRRYKHRPKPYGNIFDDSSGDGSIFQNVLGRQGGIFGRRSAKGKGKGKRKGLFGF